MLRVANISVSALSFELGAGAPPSEIRLIPSGAFRSYDGRPEGVPNWHLPADRAMQIVAQAASRESDLVIDYEHATLSAAVTGNMAPAAGWFKRMDWRPDGLYATDVRWTAAAARMIAAGEKRYISPVFGWDKRTGEVLGVRMAGLVNDPGLDGLADLSALAAGLEFGFLSRSQDAPDYYVPKGYTADPDSVRLHTAALAYQESNKGVSYQSAVSAVIRYTDALQGIEASLGQGAPGYLWEGYTQPPG
jgi:hypothetical protein